MDKTTNWLAVYAVALGAFALVTTEFLPIGMLSSIAEGLNTTKGMAGLSMTFPGLVGAIAAPTLILLSRTLDRKKMLLLLAGAVCISNIISATATSLPVFLAGRALLGVGVGGFWSFALPVARRLAHESAGNRATSIVSAAIALSTIVSLPAGALLSEWLGWRTTFMINGAFTMGALLLQWLLLPRLPVSERFNTHKLLGLFRVPQARIGFVVITFLILSHFVAYTYMEPFLRDITKLSPDRISLALLMYGIAGFFGTFLGEKACTRFGVKQTFLIVILLIFMVTSLMALAGVNPIMAFLLTGIWGLAFGAVPMCANIWMYESSPEAFEGGAAMLVTVFQISLASGSFFGGMLADHVGLVSTYGSAGFLALLAAVVLQLSRIEKKSSTTTT